MEGFLRYEFGGLIFGGAYTWRGLFSEFYGIQCRSQQLDGINFLVLPIRECRLEYYVLR